MTTLLVSIVNNVYLVVGTAVFGAVAIVAGWIGSGRTIGGWAARWWSRGILLTGGARVETEFEEPIDHQGVYVFVCNHQSLFDIPALLWTLPVPTRFLAKRSLFRIPVLGTAMRSAGFIPVDRRDKSRARESLDEAVTLLQEGTSVLVFPEETRSDDGRVLPFRRGGFLIAAKAGVPLVPIGLQGTMQVRQKDSYATRPGQIRIRYGAPMQRPRGGPKERREFVDLVRRRVAELAGAATSNESTEADSSSIGTATQAHG